MKYLREMFNDLATRAAAAVLVLIILLVIFNALSGITVTHPLIAVFTFLLVPVLFILGGIIFTIAILKNRTK